MIIIGHKHIPCESFKSITTTKEIHKTSQILWFYDSLENGFGLAKKCAESNIAFSVHISNITNCLLYASFNPKYLLISQNAKTYQKIAEHYLLDSKILQIIKNESTIQNVAKKGIDGVIFKHHLQID